jgi:hypothetical protein
MPDVSCQTEKQIFARRKKDYYDCSISTKRLLRGKINFLIAQSDLKRFIEKIGLRIQEIKFGPNDAFQRQNLHKLTILPMNVNEDMKVYSWMAVKELTNMSERKYILIRKFLLKNCIEKIPSLERLSTLSRSIDNSFIIYPNDYGFFLDPSQKIKFVCEKFLERNEDFSNRKFKIRFCADGVTINKKHLQCLNLAFTLLDDEKNCKNVNHTYILGKLKDFFIFGSEQTQETEKNRF